MRIGLVSRTDKEEAIQLVKKIAEQLSHHELYYDSELLPFVKGELIKDVDVLVVVGGDGTILRTVRKYYFPIVAVKMGNHGHLCEIQPEEISSLESILQDYTVDKRMKIEVAGAGEALNEVVVRARVPDKLAQFTLEYGNCTECMAGDGVIISTPTGSSAYSQAAGGPLIEESLPVLCITPICSFNRAFLPRVISSEWEITITVMDRDCHVTLDGGVHFDLRVGESIKVRKSSKYAVFWRKKVK